MLFKDLVDDGRKKHPLAAHAREEGMNHEVDTAYAKEPDVAELDTQALDEDSAEKTVPLTPLEAQKINLLQESQDHLCIYYAFIFYVTIYFMYIYICIICF